MLPRIPTAEDLVLAEAAARAWWPAACEALEATLAAQHPDCVLVVQDRTAWVVWAPDPAVRSACARGAPPWRRRRVLDRLAVLRIRWDPHPLRAAWFLEDLVHGNTQAETIPWDAWSGDWTPLVDHPARATAAALPDALAHCPPARCGWGPAAPPPPGSWRDDLLGCAGIVWLLGSGWAVWCWPDVPTLGWPTALLPGSGSAALAFGLAALGGLLLRAAHRPGLLPETRRLLFFAYLVAAEWGLLVLLGRAIGFFVGPTSLQAIGGWAAATTLGCLVGFGRFRRGRLAPPRIPPAPPPSCGG